MGGCHRLDGFSPGHHHSRADLAGQSCHDCPCEAILELRGCTTGYWQGAAKGTAGIVSQHRRIGNSPHVWRVCVSSSGVRRLCVFSWASALTTCCSVLFAQRLKGMRALALSMPNALTSPSEALSRLFRPGQWPVCSRTLLMRREAGLLGGCVWACASACLSALARNVLKQEAL